MFKHYTLPRVGWSCLVMLFMMFGSLNMQAQFASRIASNTTNCGGGTTYGFFLSLQSGNHYFHFPSNAQFVENANGTATFSGSIQNAGLQFNFTANLSGRTFNVPAGSPKAHYCLDEDISGWYYYTNVSGTLTGIGNTSGASISFVNTGVAFQVGNGANITSNNLNFGASGWLNCTVNSQPYSGTQLAFHPNTGNGNGDISIMLSGVPFTDPNAVVCSNVTSGGQTSGNQSVCTGAAASTITNVTSASGGSGNLEYIWLGSTSNCPGSVSQAIPGATGATYNPGVLTQTTYFRRCARRAGCTSWVGEANCVTITVLPSSNPACETDPCDGQGGDSDNDGVCNNQDCQPFNPSFPATPGTPCNDGNPNTTNDVVTANGCGCAGTPIGGGIDCTTIDVSTGSGSITINNLDAPIVKVQIFDLQNGWNMVLNCAGNCNTPTETVNNLASGTYKVKVTYFTAAWSPICDFDEDVTVTGGGGGCSNVTSGGQTSGNQSVCTGAAASTITNVTSASGGSGNLEYIWLGSTSNCPGSVSQAIPGATGATYNPGVLTQTTYFRRCSRRAGCTSWVGEANCVTITVLPSSNPACQTDPCDGQGGDSDNDGVCNNQDCQPFNPSFPATPGTPCNDGNPNTSNDVVTANGCGCAGTPIGGGIDCTTIDVSTGSGSITINNLDAPIVKVQIFDLQNGWNMVLNCAGNCNTPTETVNNLASGTYKVKVTYFTAAWSPICDFDEDVTVTGGGGGCSNVTSGGQTSGNQSVCTGAAASTITNVTSASGGSGNLEYIWLGSTSNCPGSVSQAIPGATGATYNPGVLTQTTYFRRCSRRAGCTSWVGEANCVTITVLPSSNPACQTDPCDGQGGDSDNDGVCNNQDCQPFNPSFPATPGTPCNDGNPNTSNDVVTANGCGCAGTPIGGGIDCTTIDVSTGSGSITINNLDAPIVKVQIFDLQNGWNMVLNCAGNCNTPTETVNNLASGTYKVKVTYFTAAWSPICDFDEDVTVTGGGGGCSNVTSGGQTSGNQSVCTGAAASTITNVTSASGGSGNLEYIWLGSTSNCPGSVSQAIPGATGATYNPGVLTQTTYFRRCSRRAGCTSWVGEANCVTITVLPSSNPACETDPCDGQGGDSDNDGVCNNQDCQPFNPSFPATPGTPCNDGNPNTSNDVVTANGCGCAGTPIGGGIDCTTIDVSTGSGSITINNLDAPIVKVQIFDLQNGWNMVLNCAGNCNTPTETVNNLASGTYKVKVTYFTAAWSPICDFDEDVTVTGGGGGCSNVTSGGQTSGNQSVCTGAAASTITNVTSASGGSGNLEYIWLGSTSNCPGSVSQAIPGATGATYNPGVLTQTTYFRRCSRRAGCTSWVGEANCVTITVLPSSNPACETDPCDGQGGDSDNDGVCNNQDCQPFNPSFPATPGTPCNDGNPNTSNDVVTANGCGCAGTTVGPNVCQYRNATNSRDNCGSGNNYGFYGSGLVSGIGGLSPNYTIANGSWTEYEDGTANYTATATNVNNGNVRFAINVNLTGRTATAPFGSPKTSDCYTINTNDWYYYTGLSGTLTGQGSLAGGVVSLSLIDLALQVGTGANLVDANEYGASSWLNYNVISHPSAGGVSFTNGAQTDFNIRLSGGASTCPGGNSNTGGNDCDKDILFVVGNTNLNAGDNIIRNRLIGKGYNVMLADDNYVTESDATGKDLIIISSTVASYNIGNEFTHTNIPLITWEAWIYDDLNMVSGTQSGSSSSVTQGTVVGFNSNHPILAGVGSGNVTIYNQPSGANWGTAYGSNDLLYIPNNPTKCLVIAFEAGTALANNATAPARRVGLFLQNETASHLTSTGWKIFDQSVYWATNCTPTQNYVGASQYLSFQAQQEERHVNLYWANNTGEMNDRFILERSADGVTFEPLGEKASYTNNDARTYSDVDMNPIIGDNYYRLKLMFRSGAYMYTDVRKVSFNDLPDFGFFPNPAKDYVQVNMDNVEGLEVEVQIYDQLGRVLQTTTIENATNTPVSLDLTGFQNGSYLILMKAEGRAPVTKPLVIMRY